MEFVALSEMPFYNECAPLVESLGLQLVELKLSRHKGSNRAAAVIAPGAAGAPLSTAECAKVHRLLAPLLEELINGELGMEVSSPGLERTIRNAAELGLYKGREIRIWDTRVSQWRRGTVLSASEKTIALEISGTTEEVPFALIAKAKLGNL